MKKDPALVVRNQAMSHVRHFAQSGNVEMAQAWLDRAAKHKPLTALQVWMLKKKILPTVFKQLDFSKVTIEARVYETAGKRGPLICQ